MIQPPQAAAGECPENREIASKSRIPVVCLDVDVLTDTVASRLATTLLGHVLYLKNQIPLPVVQLARMVNRKGNTKAAKMRTDFLSSFDTLTSHLVTTFSALSTALAKAKSSSSSDDVSRAYMAILVGPSLGTAKSRVIYGVDNLAAHVWGTRDDGEAEVDEEDSGEEYPEDSEDDEEDDSTESGSSVETDPEVENSPENCDKENAESFQDGQEATDEEEDDDEPARQESQSSPPSTQLHQSFAEEQRFLHSADRLLAQVLASADAEGHGISNEMSPSQIHILLRAPRRFVHPVWAPRQNIQKQMEAALADFIGESWPSQENNSLSTKKKKKPVEGVWVTGKSGLRGPPVSSNEKTNVPEENEMIWWSWDGKLVGFTDW